MTLRSDGPALTKNSNGQKSYQIHGAMPVLSIHFLIFVFYLFISQQEWNWEMGLNNNNYILNKENEHFLSVGFKFLSLRQSISLLNRLQHVLVLLFSAFLSCIVLMLSTCHFVLNRLNRQLLLRYPGYSQTGHLSP